MRKTLRKALLGAMALLSVLTVFSLSACSGGLNQEKQAEGYYEGPMLPKSQRVGPPGGGTPAAPQTPAPSGK
jgi:uncharacterized lipoprotein